MTIVLMLQDSSCGLKCRHCLRHQDGPAVRSIAIGHMLESVVTNSANFVVMARLCLIRLKTSSSGRKNFIDDL